MKTLRPALMLSVLLLASGPMARPSHADFATRGQKIEAIHTTATSLERCAQDVAQSVKDSLVPPGSWPLDCSEHARADYSRALFAAYDMSASTRSVLAVASELLRCPPERLGGQLARMRSQWDQDLKPRLDLLHERVIALSKPGFNPVVTPRRIHGVERHLGLLHQLTAQLSLHLGTPVRVKKPVLRPAPRPVSRPHRPAARFVQDEHGEAICPYYTGDMFDETPLRVRLLVTRKNDNDYQQLGIQVVNPHLTVTPTGSRRSVSRIEIFKNGRPVWKRTFDRHELHRGSRNVPNTAKYPDHKVERIAGDNLRLRSTGERYVGYNGILVRHDPRTESGTLVVRLYDSFNQLVDSWVTDFAPKKSAVW